MLLNRTGKFVIFIVLSLILPSILMPDHVFSYGFELAGQSAADVNVIPQSTANQHLSSSLVVLPPKGSAALQVAGFSMSKGLPFPDQTLVANGVAPVPIQIVLEYSIERGYIFSNPYEVQLAIWATQYGLNPELDHLPETDRGVIEEIGAYVGQTSQPMRPSVPALNLWDAVATRAVSAKITNFVDRSVQSQSGAYYGEGTMLLTNNTVVERRIYIPYGIRFRDELNSARQDIVIFAAVANPAAPDENTATESPTPTVEIPVVTATPVPPIPEEPTPTVVVEIATPEVPTPPHVQETATSAATATVPATVTPTAMPQETPTEQPTKEVPPTDRPDDDAIQNIIGLQGEEGPSGPAGPRGPRGVRGIAGLNCWDLDADGQNDPNEDVNGDGDHTALDCQGPAGQDGRDGQDGQDGLACWDLDADGRPDANEDVNNDGKHDVFDCRGQDGVDGQDGKDGADGLDGVAGPVGLSCWDLDGDGNTDDNEDVNNDGKFDALDCRGSGTPGEDGTDGQDGTNGLACWDLDADGQADESEDINGDGQHDALDCRGADGQNGTDGQDGVNGLACWDLDADGQADESEDINGDGQHDALDCRGADGQNGTDGQDGVIGLACWDLDADGQTDENEDINGDGQHDTLDCRGETGPAGPQGPKGEQGEVGNDGLSCWDLDADGQADDDEDLNGDGFHDVLDCRGITGPAGETGPRGASGPAGPFGPRGADGLSCWDLNQNGETDPDEDINLDGEFDTLDCRGRPGRAGPIGPPGPVNPASEITIMSQATELEASLVKELTVQCEKGQKAISGGVKANSSVNGENNEELIVTVQESYPLLDIGWHGRAEAWNIKRILGEECTDCQDEWKLTVWVICQGEALEE